MLRRTQFNYLPDVGLKRASRGWHYLMVLLQGLHSITAALHRLDSQSRGSRAAYRGHNRRAGIDGRGADFDFIGPRRLAGGCVDHELDLAVLEQVQRVGPSLVQFENA